ncbi:hypothetical protein DFA_09890 [Cavenderia fasciculata]|uniref:Uncharacterized protein n=1 Tax=Cavenderia fasciculata TaxID=261658 RepID=F4Q8P8_CACFS|nr:uncharacterized protein DFA_09890 [Cavenderia fasciculata]EGG15067.1 hypothetical protein DFA_09890 [Cavenderia fasciculata]|eukprot:XP_004351787.1 hypothetical protein DFA_09890 [Cavenderia fasciculata]
MTRPTKPSIVLGNFRITITGDRHVGKHTFIQSLFGVTSVSRVLLDEPPILLPIINQLDNHIKWNNTINNVDVKFKLKVVVLKEERFKLHSQVSIYRQARIVFILFDVTDQQSFENLKGWHGETQRYCWEMVEVVFIGTKRDLVNQRKVTREQANDFALGLGCSYFEVGQDDDTCIDRISKYIRNIIFKQITTIHLDLNVQVARGIGIRNISFWCTNRYFNVLKYYKTKSLPIQITNIAKLSSFLRMPGNLELLQYIVEKIDRLYQNEKCQIVDEVIIGGDLSKVQYLYSKGFYWTFEGLLMAIALDHIEIVKFIVEMSGKIIEGNRKDLSNRPPFLNQDNLKRCIKMAKSYNRKEIGNIMSLKKQYSTLIGKLANLFSTS